jgi:hypothetical protein
LAAGFCPQPRNGIVSLLCVFRKCFVIGQPGLVECVRKTRGFIFCHESNDSAGRSPRIALKAEQRSALDFSRGGNRPQQRINTAERKSRRGSETATEKAAPRDARRDDFLKGLVAGIITRVIVVSFFARRL